MNPHPHPHTETKELPMTAIEPQKAEGKVLFHFTMSLDGFVAGPGHALDWMTGFTGRDGVEEEYIATTGAVLGGRDGLGPRPDRPPLRRGLAGSRCSSSPTIPRTPSPPRA